MGADRGRNEVAGRKICRDNRLHVVVPSEVQAPGGGAPDERRSQALVQGQDPFLLADDPESLRGAMKAMARQ